jgi:hypothetical protein
MQTLTQGSPLARAIASESAEWLEANCPEVYDALRQELAAGRSVADVRRTLRRMFGPEQRDAFVLRVLQTAEHIKASAVG